MNRSPDYPPSHGYEEVHLVDIGQRHHRDTHAGLVGLGIRYRARYAGLQYQDDLG